MNKTLVYVTQDILTHRMYYKQVSVMHYWYHSIYLDYDLYQYDSYYFLYMV